MYNAMPAPRDFAQLIEVTRAIDVGEKARLPIIAPLDNMLRYAGKIELRLTRYEA
jgi:hypothetical protein